MTSDMSAHPLRFLILEDNVADAQLTLRKLNVSGLRVDAKIAHSATDFMQKIESETFDMVLCDFTLPGWSGLDALRWLRESGHEMPFIYVSGTLGEELAVECIKLGATDYVLKSNLGRLPHAVRRALEEQDSRRQRNRIESELRTSEEQYRLLFESNPQPMWVYDRSTLAFMAVNEEAIRHYGYSREEFLGMTILDIRPSEDVDRVLRSTWRDRTHPLQNSGPWKHRLKDGTIIDVEITSNEINFRGIRGTLVLAVDITERLKSQEKLRHSEERFSKAFRSCPMAITLSTVSEGRYVDVNDAFMRMVGLKREELVGRRALELNIWAFPQDRETMILELEQSGRVSGLNTVFNSRSSGPRSVQLFAERVWLDGMPCVLALTHDVTDARVLEEQFRQAQKMEAVGRLAGGVAHDFNNMLSIILGYCDLAEAHRNTESYKRDVDQIKKAAQRAANLTRQLLAFSRQQIVRPSVLNLNTVVTDLGQMLNRVLPSNIKFTFKAGSSLGNIKADVSQIDQILVNLVVNAKDAMPHGGDLLVESSNVELDQSHAMQHAGTNPGQYVSLSVTDTGCGMNQETMSRIFEPFFTTKPRGRGSGLGLSMVYGAMQEYGGHVNVTSEVGIGTTLALYFPRVDDVAEARPAISPPVTVLSGSETVLVVEDEDAVRGLLVKMLECEGYNVLKARDAESAIGLAQEHRGAIQILLTDVILPSINGGELAAELLQSRPDLKVLYISGYTGDLINDEHLIDKKATIVEKPFTRNTLLRKMRELLDSGSSS
jgi:PAS domain S-box-containing protein